MKHITAVLTALFIILPLTTNAHEPPACELEQPTPANTTYSNAIQLSEVYPSPAEGEEEFIELYNSSARSIDLAGWMLADASGKTYTISVEDFLSTTIAGHGFFVVPHSISKIYLNNTDDAVLLYQPNEKLLDETAYEAASKGQSWSTLKNSWHWTLPTENKANAKVAEEEKNTTSTSQQETSSNILLSELLPNPSGPDGTDEWIEIENTSNASVYLGGWQLTDGSRYYTIRDVRIGQGEFLLFEVTETKINLNNSGDTVYLIDPFGEITHGTTYESPNEGQSWARIGDEWQWTDEPTPAEENKTPTELPEDGEDVPEDENNEDILSIVQIRSIEDGGEGVVEGVVTVLPGVLGSQYFYIQDDTAGIQIYSYRKDFPDLEVGDVVRVSGEKATTREEARLKTSSQDDIQVVSSGNELEPLGVAELEESVEGMFVEVEGEISEKSSSKAVLNDSIILTFKSGANIDKAVLEEGTTVAVRGLVTQSNDEYKLAPRSSDDISAKETTDIPFVSAASASGLPAPSQITPTETQNDQTTTLLIILIAGLAAIIGGLLWKQKQQATPRKEHKKVRTIFDKARG